MTLRIFTFGWSPELVIKPLIEDGVSKADTIVLIGSKPETDYTRKRVDEALHQVKKFLAMAGVPSVEYFEVDLSESFVDICKSIVRIVKNYLKDQTAVFYLTGGMRILVIAALIVARLLSTAGLNVSVKTSYEDRPVICEVPRELLTVSVELTKSQVEILKYLNAVGEGTFEDLAIGRSKVTVRKLLTKLRKRGVVAYEVRGRRQVYKLTPLGELVLEVLDIAAPLGER